MKKNWGYQTWVKLKAVDLRTDTPKKDAENKKEIKVGYLAWPLTIGPIVLWIQTGVYASFGVDATFSLKRNQTFTLKANNVEFLIDKLETLNFPKITCESPVIEKGPMKTTFSVKGEISAGAGWEIISLVFFTPDNKLGLKTDVDLKIDAEFEMTDEISEEGSNFSVDFPSAKAVLDYHIKGFYNFEISSCIPQKTKNTYPSPFIPHPQSLSKMRFQTKSTFGAILSQFGGWGGSGKRQLRSDG